MISLDVEFLYGTVSSVEFKNENPIMPLVIFDANHSFFSVQDIHLRSEVCATNLVFTSWK